MQAMPLFDLECQACQHRWEDMVKINEAPPPCPECGAADVAKLPGTKIIKPGYVPSPGTTMKLQTEKRPDGTYKVHGYTEEKRKKPVE